MSDISLQRYKARRAFQSLKEDKHMDNSEYVKLKSVIQNVKETRKDVVVDSVVADPQNLVYVFILDNAFNGSTSRATDTSDDHDQSRYITDVSVNSSNVYTVEPPVPMSSYANGDDANIRATVEDMIIKFDTDIKDGTNFYHYIKVHADVVELSNIVTDVLATNIQAAILNSIAYSRSVGNVGNDTIIKRVIVAHGTADIKTVYDAAYGSNANPAYSDYKNTVTETLGYDHISNVDAVIASINAEGTSYMDAYSPSNTIVLYPNNNDVSDGLVDVPSDYPYSGDASIFFRRRMSEQNNDKYTLLYTEWSRVDDIEYAPSATVYDGVDTLTPATHYRLGEKLAALE